MNTRQIFLRLVLPVAALVAASAGIVATVPMARAQTSIDNIVLSSDIENPLPGQSVTVTARSYSIDISSASIRWTAGGKSVGSGMGKTSVVVPAPPLGKSISVTATVTALNGMVMANSLTLSSESVDLIIEPDGYAPATFLGKLQPSYQNTVKVIAMPHIFRTNGTEYASTGLVYKWEQGSNVLESSSGYGRQSVSIPGGIVPSPYQMKVTVSTPDGSLQAIGYTTVTPVAPTVIFYRNDPLYGPMYNSAVNGSIDIGSQHETGILAVPYGFDPSRGSASGLALSWLINGTLHPELASSRTVTLRAPDSTTGTSDVELDVSSSQNILQRATGTFAATFRTQSQ